MKCPYQTSITPIRWKGRRMTKWIYRGFMFRVYTDWIYLLPTIEIHTEDMTHIPSEIISIALHFLVIHARWLWRLEPYREDGDTE